MNQRPLSEAEIEPDAEAIAIAEIEHSNAELVAAGAPLNGIAAVLPLDFPLATLLRFLPDVSLKRRADALAVEAMSIKVDDAVGLAKADAALAPLREKLDEIDACFDEPTSLAFQLHKRMTGLRSDFKALGAEALRVVGQRVVATTKRLADLAAEEQRKAQAEADRQARESAARAAAQAEKSNAAPAVVEALKQRAETATAPPVAPPVAYARPTNNSVAANWKARLKGTPPDAEPNPKMGDLTAKQQEQIRRLMGAVARGEDPLSYFEINWSALNARARADKNTFSAPEIEAFDAGALRKKPGR